MATDVFTVRWAVTRSKHLYSLSEDRVVCYVEGQVAGQKELCNLLIKISVYRFSLIYIVYNI